MPGPGEGGVGCGGGVCVSAGAFILPRSVPPAPSLGPPASTLRTRSPDPAQPSSLGDQNPASPQACHLTWREPFVQEQKYPF